MAPGKALANLALQKRFLLAESEARRLLLASELHRAIRPIHWAGRFRRWVRPLLTLSGPLAGFWFVRRSKGVRRWATVGLWAMRLFQRFRRFVRHPRIH